MDSKPSKHNSPVRWSLNGAGQQTYTATDDSVSTLQQDPAASAVLDSSCVKAPAAEAQEPDSQSRSGSPVTSSNGISSTGGAAPGSCTLQHCNRAVEQQPNTSEDGWRQSTQHGMHICALPEEAIDAEQPWQAAPLQLAAPALSLDGTVWPRMAGASNAAPTAALTAPPAVPPLRLSLPEPAAAMSQVCESCPADAVSCRSSSAAAAHQQPTHASAAGARAAAGVEAPWTQNTARALRRAQQDVVDLCRARGLPLPAERAYCFDLVGIRAAGYGCNSNSRPIASLSGGWSAAGGKGTASTTGSSSLSPSSSGAGAGATAACRSPTGTDLTSWSRCQTPIGLRTGQQPQLRRAAAAAGAGSSSPTPIKQQQPEPPGRRPRSAGVLSGTSHGWPVAGSMLQQRQRPYSSSHTSRPAKASTATQNQQQADASSIAGLLECAEQSLAVHSALLSRDAACSTRGGSVFDLPQRWWEVNSRALSDPLLLRMPVWLREALELELMEV